LRELNAGLPALFECAGVDLDRLKMVRRDVYDLSANWKIVIENFKRVLSLSGRASEIFGTHRYRRL
jgi:hypothetical protein